MSENLRALRRKIRTVRSIEHITRAMQFVATAKLAKLQKQVTAGREYAEHLRELLRHVAASEDSPTHPYLIHREPEHVGLVVIAGERGMAGAFNQQIMRLADDFLARAWAPVSVLTIGAKATRWAERRGVDIIDSWPGIAETGRSSPALEVSRRVRALYEQGRVDQVHVVYEDFQTILRHLPRVEQFLPVPPDQAGGGPWGQYDYSPPAAQLLEVLLPQALDGLFYQMVLGTQTSEQAARMTAMQGATDNAGQMITSLTRRLNRARQYGITGEIMDVVGGASAIGAI
ncbi:MAG TPA: ATP synthase F1 subunit gamma [Armatimonadota bacterium]|jgi:F-type H+-transporting ATPase subunit gamma